MRQIKESRSGVLVFEDAGAHPPMCCCSNQCAVDLTFKANPLLTGSRGDKKEKVECVAGRHMQPGCWCIGWCTNRTHPRVIWP